MNNGSNRLDRIEAAIENLTNAIVAERQSSSERFKQIEEARERDRQQSNERMARIEQMIERQQRPIEVLAASSADHEVRIARQDALIERLDAILERMIYREGRGNEEG